MGITQIPIEIEVENFPQYVEFGEKRYELNKINRLSDNGSSALLIIYREKVK